MSKKSARKTPNITNNSGPKIQMSAFGMGKKSLDENGLERKKSLRNLE